MIAFISAVDTDVVAARSAVALLPGTFPEVRVLTAQDVDDEAALRSALCGINVAVVRILGGRAYFPRGFDALEKLRGERGLRILAIPGDAHPDADLDARSTAPVEVLRRVHAYAFAGGAHNLAQMFALVANVQLELPFTYSDPEESPEWGLYHPDASDRAACAHLTAQEFVERHWRGRAGSVGILFYRADWAGGNLAHVDALVRTCEQFDLDVLPVFVYSLRDCERIGGLPAPYVRAFGAGSGVRVDVIASLLSYAIGDPHDSAQARFDIPVVQAVTTGQSLKTWLANPAGLGPLDAATKVVMPEIDGRIAGPLFAFRAACGLMYADRDQTDALVRLLKRYVALRRKPNREKRVAIVLTNFANRQGRVGGAVGLDTPASVIAILRALQAGGYCVDGIPPDGEALMANLLALGGYDTDWLTQEQIALADAAFDERQYDAWFASFDESVRSSMENAWGAAPGDAYRDGDRLYVAGARFGNVFVMIQPPRGFGENPLAVYHSGDLVPTHQYVGAYRWLRDVFGADAIVQCGKHGTLEWLPGKSLGLSARCFPALTQDDIPLFYPFIVDDPGEGAQAKRRAHACIIDHLIPPMTKAQTYDELAKLSRLLGEYAAAERIDPDKAPLIAAAIWQTVVAANLQRDLEVEALPQGDAFGAFLQHVDGYLCELGDMQIRDGLHVLGTPPDNERLIDLALALVRVDSTEALGALHAMALDCGFDYGEIADAAHGGKPYRSMHRTVREVREELEARIRSAVHALLRDEGANSGEVLSSLNVPADGEFSRTARLLVERIVPNIRRASDELENLLAGLSGRHVPAGPSGAPTRGMINVLPTGRNFYTIDVRAVPSRFAWLVGVRMGDTLLRAALKRDGTMPKSIAITVWGTANMRTQGDDVAEILWLLGVRPVWHPENGRVVDLEVVPLEELGRPRIDVTVRISGFFRDSFPQAITLIDRAVSLIAGLQENGESNYLRAAVERSEQANLAAGMAAEQARRRARFRVFGNKPGAYGTGVLELISSGAWQTRSDLAHAYLESGGFAYGGDRFGEPAPAEFRARLAESRIAVQNQDNREHDIFDSDTYLQHHGGMIAAIRELSGEEPSALFGDSSDPQLPKTRTLQEEARRVFRARVANPKWLAGMRRHGYKGALEMTATVDYLFGYDAAAGVVEDWMYEDVAQSYLFDAENREFLRKSNPWGAREMTERLLEASARGLWEQPSPATLERLRDELLALDGTLEDRAEVVYAH
jgi:cobaltochelatase CobN